MKKVQEIQHAYNYEVVEKLDEFITARIIFVELEWRHDARLPWSEEIHETWLKNTSLLYVQSLERSQLRRLDWKETSHTESHTRYTNKNKENRTTQSGSKTCMNIVERIPIQNNDIIGGEKKGIYSKSSQYVSPESSKNLQKTSKITVGFIQNYQQNDTKALVSALSKYCFLWKEKHWNTKHSLILYSLERK